MPEGEKMVRINSDVGHISKYVELFLFQEKTMHCCRLFHYVVEVP